MTLRGLILKIGIVLWLSLGATVVWASGLEQRCNSGDQEGCTELGMERLKGGKGAEALSLFERACRGGSMRGCYMLASRSSQGQAGFELAKRTLKEGCRGANPEACFYGATLKRRLLKDYQGAALLYERGCNLKEGRSCSTLGYLYASGRGVKRSLRRAMELFKKGCGLDDPSGCFNLALMLRKTTDSGKEDYSRSVEPFRKSCELGMARGCFNLGVIYSTGKGVKRDHGLAKGFFHKACKSGDKEGCFNAGLMYLEGKDFDVATALSLLKRSCSMGYSRGCDAYNKLKAKKPTD